VNMRSMFFSQSTMSRCTRVHARQLRVRLAGASWSGVDVGTHLGRVRELVAVLRAREVQPRLGAPPRG
jgi:hypothetical protein